MPSVVDPVCGAKVDPEKTPYKTVYKGKTYYFCCPMCMEKFESNPEKYVKREEKEEGSRRCCR